MWPEPAAMRRSLVILVISDWRGSKRLWLAMCRWSWADTALVRVLFKKGRLEFGLQLAKSSKSKSGFSGIGLTEAILRLRGTVPFNREQLMISVITGQWVGKQASTSVVGIDSLEQVVALVSITNLVVNNVSTEVKDGKGGHTASRVTSHVFDARGRIEGNCS